MREFEKTELDFPKAKEKALKMLDVRSHTEKEIRDKLKQKGADFEICDEVIAFLNEYKLIDDRSYAKMYARDLQNLKSFGKNRIRQELMKKGISSDIFDEVLAELDDDSTDTLKRLMSKKLNGDFEKKSVDRAIRYFLTKGYSFDMIKKTVGELKGEPNDL